MSKNTPFCVGSYLKIICKNCKFDDQYENFMFLQYKHYFTIEKMQIKSKNV